MKSRKRVTIFNVAFLLLIIGLSQNISAQPKREKIDQLFSYYNENGMFNGVVLLSENGKISYHKAFGFADFENKIPLDTSSVFAIASLTKPFTATAIMMLEEQGKLSYDDKLAKYFPEFPDYSNQITIKNLLTHTSGIVDYLSKGLKLQNKLPYLTSQIVLDSLSSQASLYFKPGEKFSYSNSNYLLLALIIEKVSGQPFGKFLKDNIFIPLGMNNTYVN